MELLLISWPWRAAADKDRDEVQHQTELQERALDGIDSAVDDLEVMSKVRPPLCLLTNQVYIWMGRHILGLYQLLAVL